VGNIIKPLAEREKVSYAELVGPRMADWFVSHYWGTAFRHFCDSLARHANAASSAPGHDPVYWICFCANNQFNLAHEMGSGVRESSFFLALHGGVQGTCLVLDDEALPLTRSWCIYEVFHSIQLDSSNPTFSGLEFCTATGVLNRGEGSAELVGRLGSRIARLDMEKATASNEDDDRMIKEEVILSMGGFATLNDAIRTRTMDLVQKAGDQMMRSLASVRDSLKPLDDASEFCEVV